MIKIIQTLKKTSEERKARAQVQLLSNAEFFKQIANDYDFYRLNVGHNDHEETTWTRHGKGQHKRLLM